MSDDDILIRDSATKFGPEAEGKIGIAASHGGVYSGYLAAKAGLRGVILHDAGIGKDEAGIGALAYLDTLSVAGAVVDGPTATIGDGASLSRGTIGRVNETARAAGCRPGQETMACARFMRLAPSRTGKVPAYEEARFILRDHPGEALVVGCDSTSLVRGEDLGRVVVTGSHGDLLRNDPSWGKRPDVLAAVFNDAGSATVSRLPDLDRRGIAGVTVTAASARIGDARSTYEDGILSHVNGAARARGAKPGMTCRAFVDLMIGAETT